MKVGRRESAVGVVSAVFHRTAHSKPRRKKLRLRLRRPKVKMEIPAPDSTSTAPPPPPWIELPGDVTADILRRLGAADILESAECVCTTWRSVCKDPSLWRVIDMRTVRNPSYSSYELECICGRAVDRSQGQLIDISIEYFGTDRLLRYISQCSNHIRRISIAWGGDISSEGLREAVKKFPELEELHLFDTPSICATDIESIGTSCPMLKSFTFNDLRYGSYGFSVPDNEYALAVAKTMPNLCHLRLFGNMMNNEGLQAILDGCPLLELLDLRKCFKVDLSGDLGQRCSEQIKNLRHPSDSSCYYDYDAHDRAPPYSDPYSSDYSDDYSNGDYDFSDGDYDCSDGDYDCSDGDYASPFGSDDYLPSHYSI